MLLGAANFGPDEMLSRDNSLVPSQPIERFEHEQHRRRRVSLAQLEEGFGPGPTCDHPAVCPITLQPAQALAEDAYISSADGGQLYSRASLSMWLLIDSQARASQNLVPVFRSPLSRVDMQQDALRLGVPMPLRLRGTGPRDASNRLIGDCAALLGLVGVAVMLYIALNPAVATKNVEAPLAGVLGAAIGLTLGSALALLSEASALQIAFALRVRRASARDASRLPPALERDGAL